MSPPEISRKTLGLKPIAKYPNKAEACQNCAKYFEESFKQINNTIQSLQETITTQNDVIMKTLSEHKVLTERILYQEVTQNNLAFTFPLDSINGLSEINETINENNRKDYIDRMKAMLKGRLSKTLTEIMTTNLCMHINLDGVHGKKRLKDFPAFYNTLTDACRLLGSQDVEADIRNALKIIKKRFIHAKCIQNKNAKPNN
uniref:DUF4806 domain-containing protein n=1 Tax=Musca domestica TaxID=7370 RepID=A0A1I8N0Q6_MUSDO